MWDSGISRKSGGFSVELAYRIAVSPRGHGSQFIGLVLSSEGGAIVAVLLSHASIFLLHPFGMRRLIRRNGGTSTLLFCFVSGAIPFAFAFRVGFWANLCVLCDTGLALPFDAMRSALVFVKCGERFGNLAA